jgi:hypothetical protein
MGSDFRYIDQMEDDPKRPEIGIMIVDGLFTKQMLYFNGPFDIIDDDGNVEEPSPYGKILRLVPRRTKGASDSKLEIVWTPDMSYELPEEEKFDDSNLK